MRRLLVVAGLAGGLGACGWTAGMSVPEGVESVGVEVFRVERGVLERGLEARLHDELTRAVSDLVDAPLVPPSRADLVLRGTIGDYGRRGGIRNPDNQLQETGVRIEIAAELVRRRGGGQATPRASTRRIWSGYALDVPGNEGPARDRALHNLAEGLVLDLFGAPAGTPPDAPQDPEPRSTGAS